MTARRLGEFLEVATQHGELVIGSDVTIIGSAVVQTREDGLALLSVLLEWLTVEAPRE